VPKADSGRSEVSMISDTYISTTCEQRIEVYWSLLNMDAPTSYKFDYTAVG